MLNPHKVFVNTIGFVQINKLLVNHQKFKILNKQFFIPHNSLGVDIVQLDFNNYSVFVLYKYYIYTNKQNYKQFLFFKKGLIKPFYLYNLSQQNQIIEGSESNVARVTIQLFRKSYLKNFILWSSNNLNFKTQTYVFYKKIFGDQVLHDTLLTQKQIYFNNITTFFVNKKLDYFNVNFFYTNYTSIELLYKNYYNKRLNVSAIEKKMILQKNLINKFFFTKLTNLFSIKGLFKIEQIILNRFFIKYYVGIVSNKFRKFAGVFGGFDKATELVKITFLMLLTKDLHYFYKWFVHIFEQTFYRKHKKLLFTLKLFFKNYMYIYFTFFKCLGFFLKVSGKINVGGNSKKRRYTIKLGANSLTKKNIKFNYLKGIVRTPVGCLGFRQILHYL